MLQSRAYIKFNGLRVNTDGTDIRDRKPYLKIMPNHQRIIKRHLRYWNSKQNGTAVADGRGWYKEGK